MKPNLRFLLSDPAHFIALGFGSGLWPKGPGTAGTLAGWLLFPFIYAPLSDPLFGALLVACFLFGILACERTGLLWLPASPQSARCCVTSHKRPRPRRQSPHTQGGQVKRDRRIGSKDARRWIRLY